jgi:hypothetical protein
MRQINDQSQHKKQYGSTDLIVEISALLSGTGFGILWGASHPGSLLNVFHAPRMIELCAEPSILVTSRGVVPQWHPPLSIVTKKK